MGDVTEQIKERCDIVDFINQYIELKPAGSNFKARCPFHQEDTPSFMVSQAKQIFKCFGCGKGGDVFNFLQEYEGIEFKEALKLLADKTGVRLEERMHPEFKSDKNLLYDILQRASDFYQLTLRKSSQAESARTYIAKRGIDELTQDTFKLGYGAEDWDALYRFLSKKKYSDADIEKCGLISRSRRGTCFDKFRQRLIFPICDVYGRVIGFGGRVITTQKDVAKYINTPQTLLYDKSRVLYGLHLAKDAIRAQDKAVIVEGYMDVIASQQAGIRYVVASSGTSLTKGQLQLVKRFTKNIALAFDMDDAGIAAALRTYRIAHKMGLNTQVVDLPEGKDPDELIRRDKAKWEQALKNTMHLMDFYFKRIELGLNVQNLADKKRARDLLLPHIAQVSDSIEQTHFLKKLAVLLDVEIGPLKQAMRGLPREQNSLPSISSQEKKERYEGKRAPIEQTAECLLALLLKHPHLHQKEAYLPDIPFMNTAIESLYKALQSQYNTKTKTKMKLDELEKGHDGYISELLLFADALYSDIEPDFAEREFDRLVKILEREYMHLKKGPLIHALKDAESRNDADAAAFFSEQLDTLLRS